MEVQTEEVKVTRVEGLKEGMEEEAEEEEGQIQRIGGGYTSPPPQD